MLLLRLVSPTHAFSPLFFFPLLSLSLCSLLSSCSSVWINWYSRASSVNALLGSRKRKHYHVKRSSNSPLNNKQRNIIPRILKRTNNPLQTTYLITREDAQWFRSLPAKVQQQHFSRDEQARLGAWRGSIIFDSADEALYKLGRQAEASSISLDSDSALSRSTSFTMTSGRFVDSAIDVDESLYDSFRWLDDDDSIDLRLDDYHAHLAKTRYDVSTPTATKNGHIRKPSFRRTFSLTSTQRDQLGSQLNSNQPHGLPFTHSNSTGLHNRSQSKPVSRLYNPRHAPFSSVSSIEHPAQHYKDPEARLRLRVYLASPQKFDEAVEFGFPSIDCKDDSCPRLSIDRKWKMQEATSSFFDDNGPWLDEKAPYQIHTEAVGSESDSSSQQSSNDTLTNDEPKRALSPLKPASPRRPRIVQQPYSSQQNMGGREMTLKMTLTRPDLRTTADGQPDQASPKPSDVDVVDPLRLAELPVSNENSPVWDIPEDRSVVKKVWRKLRRGRNS